MKFVKGIGLFFIYPLTMLAVGFYAGVEAYRFFDESVAERHAGLIPGPDAATEQGAELTSEKEAARSASEEDDEEALEAASSSETLYVGTQYVLQETDIDRHTVVETVLSLPDKYVGMNREQFLSAMDIYQAAPPLAELKRGFVGLEVLSFSRERVVVQMNYSYIQPSDSFYLAAYDNKVLVYLEDKRTVYIETQILLDSLPEEIQQEIIQMMWVENEEALYNFLETYSS